jgi:hypothetical protein
LDTVPGLLAALCVFKARQRGEYAFSRILRAEDLGKLSTVDFVDKYCSEALTALGNLTPE